MVLVLPVRLYEWVSSKQGGICPPYQGRHPSVHTFCLTFNYISYITFLFPIEVTRKSHNLHVMDILYCGSGFKKRARQRGIFAARANNADMWFDGFWCLNIFAYDYCKSCKQVVIGAVK